MNDIKKTLETKQNNNNVSPYPSTSNKHGYHGFEMANSESESLNPNNIYNNIQNSGNDNQLNVVSNIEDFEMSYGKDSPYKNTIK